MRINPRKGAATPTEGLKIRKKLKSDLCSAQSINFMKSNFILFV